MRNFLLPRSPSLWLLTKAVFLHMWFFPSSCINAKWRDRNQLHKKMCNRVFFNLFPFTFFYLHRVSEKKKLFKLIGSFSSKSLKRRQFDSFETENSNVSNFCFTSFQVVLSFLCKHHSWNIISTFSLPFFVFNLPNFLKFLFFSNQVGRGFEPWTFGSGNEKIRLRET